MIIFRREKWNNKYITTARDEKGKIQTWTRWNQKKSIKSMTERYKVQQTFKKAVYKHKLTNVEEITDYGSKPRLRKKFNNYQYVIEAKVGKKTIYGRSDQHKTNYSKDKARMEAYRRLLKRISKEMGDTYTVDSGLKYWTDDIKMREGIIQYRPITQEGLDKYGATA